MTQPPWDDAARIDWGTILLFGGGVSVGSLAYSAGIDTTIGLGLTRWLPVHSSLTYTALFSGIAVNPSQMNGQPCIRGMRLNPGVPAELERLLNKLLEKDRAFR